VRARAVACVQELLILHPMNVVSLRRVAGFDALLQGCCCTAVPPTLDRASLLASPAVRLGEAIAECLCYAAVLTSRHDIGVLQVRARPGARVAPHPDAAAGSGPRAGLGG
jgi:hypothetical protein